MSHALQFYIDGAWVDPAGGLKTLDVIDPSTEEAFAQIALGSQADVDKAVAAARAAVPAFAATSKEERLALMRRLLEAYKARYAEVADTLVEPEDLIKFGLIPEFVGRLPAVATLESLDEAALMKILVEPKNALTKQYTKLFKMEGVELEFRDSALELIAKKALERKTGARGLRSIMEHALLEIMFDLPSLPNLSKVVVDDGVIAGDTPPILIYSEQARLAESAS